MTEADNLTSLEPEHLYEGWGEEILEEFVKPSIERSVRYDRLTGFFSLDSLLSVAEGLDDLWRRGGEMRLILGVHDVPPEIVEAHTLEDDDVEKVVEEVRRRLLEELSTLADELHRDKISTLAWMMEDGLLSVKVACPRQVPSSKDEGIFHKKRLIFQDSEGNRLLAVGSPNETVAGYKQNVEELTVLRSWMEGQRPIVENHEQSFEEIWNDEREAMKVAELDESFPEEVLDRLDSPTEPDPPQKERVNLGEVIEAAAESPAYSVLSFEDVGLYPHQERVFVEALSRWPVRAVLADEVGLGKTMEAGAVLDYMLRFTDVEDVTILAPANLLKQWHEELHVHFGMDFWLWDSRQREYVSLEGEEWPEASGDGPLEGDTPDLKIISAQLARGTSSKGHIYEDADNYSDMLLVDEAHAARVRPRIDGSKRPTRLWTTLDHLTDHVPHVLLMTATPLQTNLEEYHALLDLLGLPEAWEDFDRYEKSLRILAKGKDAKSLENTKRVLQLISGSVEEMGYQPDGLTASQEEIVELARQSDGSPGTQECIEAMGKWEDAYEVLVKVHPAHILTLRNSRAELENRGYRFPERDFRSPELEVPSEVERFYDALHEYLWEAYGEVEKAADPDKNISLGFVKSSYHQRTASSLYSAICTLKNRRRKIERISTGSDVEDEPAEEEYEEPLLQGWLDEDFGEESELDQSMKRAMSIESTYLKDLIRRLEGFLDEEGLQDPKIEALLDVLYDHLPEEGVLVFSGYTDTLDACLEAFRSTSEEGYDVGYGMYTGEESWIVSGGSRREATKEDVKEALKQGEIKVIFCSKAASQGLNLQAARVLVNVDVPWNPARLEQRIGRIARLGQTADRVPVYNLWYPDSVEEKMYSRLTTRRDLYNLALGQAPKIVSTSIRERVSSVEGEDDTVTEDPIEKLEHIRQDVQHQAMEKVWGQRKDEQPLSTEVRSELIQVIEENCQHASIEISGSENRLRAEHPRLGDIKADSEPEDPEVLTLRHEALQLFSEQTGYMDEDESLILIEGERTGTPLGFAVEVGDSWKIVPPHEIASLLDGLNTKARVSERLDNQEQAPPSSEEVLEEIEQKSRWLPDHQELQPATNLEGPVGESPGYSDIDTEYFE